MCTRWQEHEVAGACACACGVQEHRDAHAGAGIVGRGGENSGVREGGACGGRSLCMCMRWQEQRAPCAYACGGRNSEEHVHVHAVAGTCGVHVQAHAMTTVWGHTACMQAPLSTAWSDEPFITMTSCTRSGRQAGRQAKGCTGLHARSRQSGQAQANTSGTQVWQQQWQGCMGKAARIAR